MFCFANTIFIENGFVLQVKHKGKEQFCPWQSDIGRKSLFLILIMKAVYKKTKKTEKGLPVVECKQIIKLRVNRDGELGCFLRYNGL